jgi:hypothetical protein
MWSHDHQVGLPAKRGGNLVNSREKNELCLSQSTEAEGTAAPDGSQGAT